MSATVVITPAAPAPPGQPDIAYAPDYAKFQARQAQRLKSETLPSTVPEGFPTQLTGDLVWDGESVAQTYDWAYVLSPGQTDEIDQALKHFQGSHNPTSYNL